MQERDKYYMTRVVVLELLQALKFKSSIPDTNLLLLVQVLNINPNRYIMSLRETHVRVTNVCFSSVCVYRHQYEVG